MDDKAPASARTSLTPDVAYKVGGNVAVSPDGEGCVWYDNLTQAVEQHGELPVVAMSSGAFETMRYGAAN